MAALDAIKPGEKLSLPSDSFFASVKYHVVGNLQEQVIVISLIFMAMYANRNGEGTNNMILLTARVEKFTMIAINFLKLSVVTCCAYSIN